MPSGTTEWILLRSLEAQMVDYVKTYYTQTASKAEVERAVAQYPENPAAGSPFGLGPLYALSPQYKRIAAFLGDAVFQGSFGPGSSPPQTLMAELLSSVCRSTQAPARTAFWETRHMGVP
jgi:hypothetical protein